MTSEETSAKKMRLEPAVSSQDDICAASKSSPAEGEIATNIRDLIFNITGTMPTELESDIGLTKSDGPGSRPTETHKGGRGFGSDCRRKRGYGRNRNTQDRGGICYGSEGAESANKSLDSSDILTEADVGITEYISQHEGFSGILKQRYSDFIVNEISAEGKIVQLTDTNPPKKPQLADGIEEQELLTAEQMNQLKCLQASKNTTDEILFPAEDKEVRRQMHKLIKTKFPNLDSNVIEKDGAKHICVKYLVRKGERKPECFSNGDYCRFVLYKQNTDTLQAINFMARCLRVNPGNFGYAGTKDRRGKTAQDVTVYRVTPERLYSLRKCLRNITLGNFRICKEPLKLGDLRGNHFVILLRNVTGSDEVIDVAMKSLRDFGFINYYGMQRFGTTRISTHSVGRALLQGAWTEAIDLIMKPREGDRYQMVKAREVWQATHDPQKTIDALGGFDCNERRLLQGLKQCAENDMVTALSYIPRNMRLMYAHAYQSYIWNRVLSRRIREFGLVPRVGDLAVRGQVVDTAELDMVESSVENLISDNTDSAPAESLPQGSEAPSTEPVVAAHSQATDEPVILTEDNISEFSITDIVLPLPGYDVCYPENESGSWYRELLLADGFAEDFDFRSRIKDYSLSGGYRKIIVKPDNLGWEVMSYDDYQLPLILGDLDILNNVALPDCPRDGRKFKALKMELSLPPSTYATMAVREVLKCNTSAAFQTTLNVT